MTKDQQDMDNLNRACLGNKEAMDFLWIWSQYVNLVDDICDENLVIPDANETVGCLSIEVEGDGTSVMRRVIDENRMGGWNKMCFARRRHGADRVCEMGALAIALYSHPFYLKNLAALKQIALNCTNAYLDSVNWEGSDEKWQRQWSDHYRHFGAEMVIAVAGICGGWQQMRAVSATLRTICWFSHHDAAGNAN